jgi:transcriptional regulator with XRE-family HTH domain
MVVPVWRDDPRRVGKRLRALRVAAGLSQLQLEAASGQSHVAISNLEAGRKVPHAGTVVRLARALSAEPPHFIGRGPVGFTMLTLAAAAQPDVPADRVRKWLQTGELGGTKVSRQ